MVPPYILVDRKWGLFFNNVEIGRFKKDPSILDVAMCTVARCFLILLKSMGCHFGRRDVYGARMVFNNITCI